MTKPDHLPALHNADKVLTYLLEETEARKAELRNLCSAVRAAIHLIQHEDQFKDKFPIPEDLFESEILEIMQRIKVMQDNVRAMGRHTIEELEMASDCPPTLRDLDNTKV